MAIIGTTHAASKKYDSGVILPGAKQLPGMPSQCGTIKAHEDELGFSATYQQSLIIQPQPVAILPICNVNDREMGSQLLAGGNQPM
jgi:hypothetical protein